MTRRKRTGTAGKRPARDSGVPLYDEKGNWLGKLHPETVEVTTTTGRLSSIGSKAHNKRAIAALAWITEHRPDLLLDAIEQEEEESDEDTMAEPGPSSGPDETGE